MPRFSTLKLLFVTVLFTIFFCASGYAEEKEATHFVVEYSTSGFDATTEVFAQNTATIAEEVWGYFKGKGFKNPLHVPDAPLNKDQKMRIIIVERPIGHYGDTTGIGKDGTGIPVITIDNNYSETGWIFYGFDALSLTLIHEIFHSIQQNYANGVVYRDTDIDWFWEGTAAWTQDEDVTLLGVNIDTLNQYNAVPNRAPGFMSTPDSSLTWRSYDAVLFWKYFTEKGYSVKTVLEKYLVMDPSSANDDDMLKAMEETVGGADKLRESYEKFSVACFVKTGTFGFADDGAKDLPEIKYGATFAAADNTHYQKELPNTIGQKIDDCTDAVDNFSQWHGILPRLSAEYIKYEKPSQIDSPTQQKTKMYAHVDGQDKYGSTDLYWGANICGINNQTPDPDDTGKNRVFITQISLANANKKGMSSGYEIGGSTATNSTLSLAGRCPAMAGVKMKAAECGQNSEFQKTSIFFNKIKQNLLDSKGVFRYSLKYRLNKYNIGATDISPRFWYL